MMRILSIWFKQYDKVLDGGGQENIRCFNALCKAVGKQNVESLFIHPLGEKKSKIERIADAYYFIQDMHNGIRPRHIKKIIEVAPRYDCIFLGTSLFGVIAKALKEGGYRGRIITHFHNIESIYYDAYIPKWLPGRSVVVNCATHNDRMSCIFSDKITVLTKRDNDFLEKNYGRKADIILPIALDDNLGNEDANTLINKSYKTSHRPQCVFIGSNFPANAEGLMWFVREVLPNVDIDFKVIGKNMDMLQQKEKELSNIEVHSSVLDLKPYFLNTDFIILPIFKGSGMKVKTCEALMYGRNILATSEAVEGYDIDMTKAGALCNTAEEFIEAIQRFSKTRVSRFNEYNRQSFLDKYSTESTDLLFNELLS